MDDLIERLREEADTHRIGFCEPETAALLREAAAALEAAREDAWQPIETAPREGEVLVQTLTGSVRVDDCRSVHFLIDGAKRQDDECWYVAWRPLPAIDQARGKGGRE